MTSFQSSVWKGEKSKVVEEKLKHNVNHLVKVNTVMTRDIDSTYPWEDVIQIHFALVFFLQSHRSQNNQKTNINHKNPSWGDAQLARIPDKLSRSSKTREVWETVTSKRTNEKWQLNFMWYSGCDPETEKMTLSKN